MNIQSVGNNEVIYFMRDRIDSTNSNDLKAELIDLIKNHYFEVLTLDMSKVTLITSAGLAALLKVKKAALKTNKRVHFRNVPEIVLDIIDITGFDIIFEMYNQKK